MQELREERKAQDDDLRGRSWAPRPLLSTFIGGSLLLGPVLVSWFVVRLADANFYQPPGYLGLVFWILQAIALSATITLLIHRLAERLSPLTVLLKLTLVFPDQAPSRFSTAMRIGNMKRVSRDSEPLSGSLNDAAIRAVELIVSLTHHERRTRGHTERVRAYGEMLAVEMGIEGNELNQLRWGLLLHDIGKLSVSEEILNKTEVLSSDEWEVLRNHPAAGARMVEPLREWLGEYVDAAGQHHERWDGSGYPNGLAGSEISVGGRICAIADAYDVITSKRSYKEAMSPEHARSELVSGAGTHFDPVMVRRFLRLSLRKKRSLGHLGWIFEIPAVGTVVAAAATTPAVAAAASVVTLSLATFTLPGVTPSAIAFDDPVTAVTVPLDDADVSRGDQRGGSDQVESTPPSTEPPTIAGPPIPVVVNPEAAINTTTSTTTTVVTTTTVDRVAPSQPVTQPTVSPVTSPPTTAVGTTVAPPTSTTSAPTTTAPTTTTSTTSTSTTTAAPTTTTTTTQPPSQSPVGQGFVFLGADQLPTSVAEGELQSESGGFVFNEQNQLVLDADVELSRAGPTVTPVADTEAVTIPAGTAVCVYLIHLDPTGDEINDTTISFGGEVLGFTTTAPTIQETSAMEIAGVDYGWTPNAGILVGDSIAIDGNTLTMRTRTAASDRDQVRVFVDCAQ